MRPISYSLQFRGQATLNAERVRLDLSAPGAALVTTIDALGVQGRLGDLSGGQAVLRSELSFDGESFTERGSIDFGRGHTLRFCSVEGRLADSPDPHLRHGAVVREVDGGEGQFAGAEGLITSNLLISDTGDVTDNHFGLVFVHSSTPKESCHEIRTRWHPGRPGRRYRLAGRRSFGDDIQAAGDARELPAEWPTPSSPTGKGHAGAPSGRHNVQSGRVSHPDTSDAYGLGLDGSAMEVRTPGV